jgi:SAM-dependent methyltransferase
VNCITCNTNNWSSLYKKLVRCNNCGLIRAHDRYFKKATADLYSQNYFNGLDYYNYESEKPALLKNFSNRIEKIKKYKSRGSLLEIGCAYGYFLQLASKNYKTIGIDLNKQITKIAQQNSPKSKVLSGDFSKKPLRATQFDVISMFDVIEHLKDPKGYLIKCNKLLKKRGILVIETGDIGGLLPRLQQSKWRLITPPTHLYYFNRQTITDLLSECGFTDIEISTVTFYRTLSQTIYRLFRKNIPFLGKFTFPIYTGDLMFVVARKVS